ncbi:MAG: NAD(P)H-hydrate dehydratase [Tepidisphaerales bacterium]
MDPKTAILIRKVPPLPPRPEHGHKGLFGRVLVVGGCDHMLGAPVLAATAALCCGAGLVQIAVPRTILAAALSITPELIGLPLSDKPDLDALLAAADAADALIIGPGMGQSAIARQRLNALLKLEKPAVLDADALNMLAAGRAWPKGMRLRAVLTPHPGEMRRLAALLRPGSVGPASSLARHTRRPAPQEGQRGRWPHLDEQASRQATAHAAAVAFDQTVLLKGHETIITDGSRVYVNKTGDSALSKAGSGDVLAGIIGCFLAQPMDPFDAGCLGAHIHGLCGELAGRAMTRRCPLARDLIAQLPAVFRRME